MNVLLVALGGGIGALIRSLVSQQWNTGSHRIPVGTWLANISGSLLLAILLSFRVHGSLPEWLWLFGGVGFCGAYTTFSTFGKETVHLWMNGSPMKALTYVSSSFIVSLVCVAIVLYNV